MPLLYGEGSRAFKRLQQEIIKIWNDQSIFAWYCADPQRKLDLDWAESQSVALEGASVILEGALAESPACFALSGNIWPIASPWSTIPQPNVDCPKETPTFWAVTSFDVTFPERQLVVLNCQLGPVPGTFPTLVVRVNSPTLASPIPVTRDLTHGKVTQISLATPSDLWHGFPPAFGLEALDDPMVLPSPKYGAPGHHDAVALRIEGLSQKRRY